MLLGFYDRFLLILSPAPGNQYAMVRTQEPPEGRLVVAVIYSSVDAVADALRVMERRFGRVDFETADLDCNCRQTYKEEMGEDLRLRFFAFEKLVARNALPEIKSACRKIEAAFSDKVEDYMFRTVNIDPGIMTADNLVMAAARDYRHRIYLRDGVFAEIALIWAKGRFTRLPWTSTDYCQAEAIEFFERVRASFEVVQPV